MKNEIKETKAYVDEFQSCMRGILKTIGSVPIGSKDQFPFGWRKAAKGRTVWRLLEEIISQNLEVSAAKLGLLDFQANQSEVGVYDFEFRFKNSPKIYVNIKSAIKGGRSNKDDISKAPSLYSFVDDRRPCILFVTTVEIVFCEQPLCIELADCYTVPVSWLPDIYVNPSKYKFIEEATPRTTEEFLVVLAREIEVARAKRARKG